MLRSDPEDTFQRVVDIFIAAWPMSVPTVLIVALAVRVVKLNAGGIDTLQPAKLIAAAYVEAVCFDKTGTLTANTVRLCIAWLMRSINAGLPRRALLSSPALYLMCMLMLRLHAEYKAVLSCPCPWTIIVRMHQLMLLQSCDKHQTH